MVYNGLSSLLTHPKVPLNISSLHFVDVAFAVAS
ncbi:hypothetical protein CCACVL1_11772 [Corchorus capsularis]|uniref:Uncharacterized protein n=1 Tax=Corchorus capsularis TaxID=210143 RepID=A0A1R3IJI4_COCAP|nr:hypothetical protein CCACVL1_11772 [Corchorus capsularis]